MSPPLENYTVVELLEFLMASRYANVATYCLLIYDYVLTFGDEVRLVWPAEWTLVKALFLFVRYATLLVVTVNIVTISELTNYLPDTFCRIWFGTTISFQVLAFTMINTLTSIRVIAIWGRRKDIAYVVWGALTIQTCATVVLVAQALHAWLPTTVYISSIHLCYADRPELMWAMWIPPVVYELFIVILTSIKTFHHIRLKGHKMLRTVAREGIWYFGVLFFSRSFNLILWLVAPIPLLLMGMHCALVIVTVTCNRLFLNLKRVGAESDKWDDEESEEDFEMLANV